MKWPRLSPALVIPFELLALFATALFTPWWGTAILAGVLRLLFFTSVRVLAVLSYVGWVAACLYRDYENLHGPSRIFAKLFSLSQFGFPLDSTPSRAIVFGAIGFIGFALALSSAGFVGALQNLVMKKRPAVG